MREGFFETRGAFSIGADLDGTLDAAAVGATTINGTATTFQTDFDDGDILTFVDSAGERQFYSIDGEPGAQTTLTLAQGLRTALAGGESFQLATPNSPYFVVRDEQNLTYPLQDPVLGRIGGGVSSGYRLTAPSITATLIDSISPNEGIRINSIYVRNPFQFTGGSSHYDVIFFQVNDTSGAESAITELGVNGRIYSVIENTETPVDIYIPPLSSDDDDRWGISAGIVNSKDFQNESQSVLLDSLNARISNVNAPSSMDGLMLPLIIGIRFTYGITITAS